MKTPAGIAVWLLPFMLAGCIHKHETAQVQQPLAPPIEDTPPPAPPPPPSLPPPEITVPSTTPVPDTNTQSQAPPKPPIKHKKPVKKITPDPSTQQAAVESPEVSAIGQLSTGAASDLRRETVTSIETTEHGLSSINRNLNDQEQKTATRIREFLKQARAALETGDVDGAHTLAAKAKVLLSELSQ